MHAVPTLAMQNVGLITPSVQSIHAAMFGRQRVCKSVRSDLTLMPRHVTRDNLRCTSTLQNLYH